MSYTYQWCKKPFRYGGGVGGGFQRHVFEVKICSCEKSPREIMPQNNGEGSGCGVIGILGSLISELQVASPLPPEIIHRLLRDVPQQAGNPPFMQETQIKPQSRFTRFYWNQYLYSKPHCTKSEVGETGHSI